MSYGRFAYIYDRLMKDVDYESIADFICEKISGELVLDLGCGTGNISTILAKRGYDVIGVDSSVDMLTIAKRKCVANNLDMMLLEQEMDEFELYGTVDAVVCIMDGINYILDEQKLIQTFKLVRNYLNAGGTFIFDINSSYKIREIIGNNTFVAEEDGIFYTWENEYNEDTKISEYALTFFVQDGEKYTRIDEIHYQRVYETGEILNLLKKAGWDDVEMFDGTSNAPPNALSERIFFVTKKLNG